MLGSKSDILAIFQKGPGWRSSDSAALENPSQDFKILFALGADELLAMLEDKIRRCLFFYVKTFENNSVGRDHFNF